MQKDFLLEPKPFMFQIFWNIIAESCTRNNAAESGETVTVNLTIRNEGLRTANNIVVTLDSPNLINISPPQNYGTLSLGASASRSYTFTTVKPNVPCGSPISIVCQIQENNSTGSLTELLPNLQIGEARTALREDFDGGNELPNGWTTSVEGGQQPWQIVIDEENASNRTAFSPESISPGVNELVSQSFAVPSAEAAVSFRNRYDLESTFLRNRLYDGAVLEIKIGEGA